MIILYIVAAIWMLRKSLQKYSKNTSQWICLIIGFSFIGMLVYQWFAEFKLGWLYGVPLDDDTGWIFRAATALSEGQSIDKLYLLTQSSGYDLENRALGWNNLGQYMYAIWAFTALYVPKLFDLHVNLSLVYLVQIMMAVVAALDIECSVRTMQGKADSTTPRWSVFICVYFCPIVLLNAYRLLREIWFFFLLSKLLYITICETERTRVKFLICSILLLIIRPLAIIYIVPLYCKRYLDLRIANIALLSGIGILFFGLPVLNALASVLSWSYNISSADLSTAIHLWMFPNVINQTAELFSGEITTVTILYFAQSVWNIIYIVPFLANVVLGRKERRFRFWILFFLITLVTYSVPYSEMNLTPRYKLIYLIPYVVIIFGGNWKKFKIKWR